MNVGMCMNAWCTYIWKPRTKFLANLVLPTAGSTFCGANFNLSNSSSASMSCWISRMRSFSSARSKESLLSYLDPADSCWVAFLAGAAEVALALLLSASRPLPPFDDAPSPAPRPVYFDSISLLLFSSVRLLPYSAVINILEDASAAHSYIL